jgi:hypothetical protein
MKETAMWASLPRTRIIPALLGAALLALATSGCVHHSGSYYDDGYGVAAPYRAPAHGHRYHRDGAVLVFAISLDSYVVQGYTHHYFHDDRYYRYHRGRWETGPRLRGRWAPVEVRGLPHGLRPHHVDALPNNYWRTAAKDGRDDRREVKKERREDRRQVEKRHRNHRREAAKDRRDDRKEKAKDRREDRRVTKKALGEDKREAAKKRSHDRREAVKDRREERRENAKGRLEDRRDEKKVRRKDGHKVAKKHRRERHQSAEDRDEEERDSSKVAASRVKKKKEARASYGGR